MGHVTELEAMLKRIQSQIDAVKEAERLGDFAMRTMGNLRLSRKEDTFSNGPSEDEKGLMQRVLATMRDTVAQEHAAKIRAQKLKSATALDNLRTELPRLAALACVELGQAAKALRENAKDTTHD